jgi:hypothetical protein
MLLQTNSYVVPKEKRAEHQRLLNRFRQTLKSIGCEDFEVFEQTGANWGAGEPSGRYVQLIRFRDRRHHQQVQAAEKTDPSAQKLIAEFCELINFPYQQQQGLFAVGFYNSVLPVSPTRRVEAPVAPTPHVAEDTPIEATADVVEPPPIESHELELPVAQDAGEFEQIDFEETADDLVDLDNNRDHKGHRPTDPTGSNGSHHADDGEEAHR